MPSPELQALADALNDELIRQELSGDHDEPEAMLWLAKAALLAIRDNLTDATVEVGLKANTCALPSGGELVMAVEPAWEAMINHILGEG